MCPHACGSCDRDASPGPASRRRRRAGSFVRTRMWKVRCRNGGAADESLSDQRVRRCLLRISTSLPTKSVGKLPRRSHCGPAVRCRPATWHRDAKCGDAAHMTARPAPCLHHACQSPSDQGLSAAIRRISTSLPTFSVEKCAWRSVGGAQVQARRRAGSRRRTPDARRPFETRPSSGARVRREHVPRTAPAHSLRTTAKFFRIKGLRALAAGCPQACQHNLWKSARSGVRQAGAGKRTVTVSPRPPCVVPSATVARCCSAMRFTIDSPSPLPEDVAACAPSPR
ncbi:hypothetical protein DM40_4880 [Burkholderia cenocepacia]|nr:hypothetical protein DM40_4880 [Burkholderia cenocepacia]